MFFFNNKLSTYNTHSLIGVGLVLVCFKRLLEIIIQRRITKRKELQEKLVDIASERFTIALNISKQNQKKTRFQQKIADKFSFSGKSGSLAPAYNRVSNVLLHEDSICNKCSDFLLKKYPKLIWVLMTVIVFISYLCLVALLMQTLKVPHPLEEFGGCMYFAVISGLTIGYGDIVPRKEMRWFMIFFIPINIIIFSRLLYKLDDVLKIRKKKGKGKNEKEGGNIITMNSINSFMDEDEEITLNTWPEDLLSVEALLEETNGEENITELDYLKFMLKGSGIVSQDLLDDLHDRFNQVFDHVNGLSSSISDITLDKHINSDNSERSFTSEKSFDSCKEKGGVSFNNNMRSSLSAGSGINRLSLRGSLTSLPSLEEDGVDFASIYEGRASTSPTSPGGVELKEMTSV